MKILFLGANSLDTPQLQIPAELRDVKEEFERAAKRQDIDVRAELAVRPTDLSRLLLDYRPDIVHFSGHGMELRVRTGTTSSTTREFDLPDDSASHDKSAESAILFVSSAGHAVLVPPDALTSLFGILKTQRCIVLNACFSATQARALSQHVDCVVGMTRTIRDESAIAFAAGFYQALARGKSVKEAFELGKNLIAICSLPDAEVPELYTKSGIDGNAVRFVQVESALERAPFILPFPQDKRFLGRDDDLKKLHALLQADAAIGVGAVTGMGGIGKTQLAVEYAYRCREAYPGGVYWVNAARDWQEEFARLAGKVGIRDESAAEYERLRRLAQAFVEYLEQHSKSLVIFDNVEDPLELQNRSRDIVPVDLPCRLLFTTRRQTDAFPILEIRSLDDDSALRLLLDTSTRKQLLKQGSAEDQSTARSICKTLGNLPLAIALASAYLEKRPNVPLKSYFNGLVGDGALLVMDGAKVDPRQLPTQHAQGLRATLQEQWAALRKDGDARAVLQTAALLGEAEQIPRARLSVLTGLADERTGWRDPPLDEALRELSEWSLVETLSESAIRLHPLVREFAVGKLGANKEEFAHACAARMADALYDMERLSHEVERRGVDEVLYDLWKGIFLGGEAEQQRLAILLRPIDRQAHMLRGWDWDFQTMPGFFLQQLYNGYCSYELQKSIELKLTEMGHSWLRERFLIGTEASALVRTLEHAGEVSCIGVNEEKSIIVSVAQDGGCLLWDFYTGRCFRVIEKSELAVQCVAVTADAKLAVSATDDNMLRIRDIETNTVVHKIEVPSDSVTKLIIPAGTHFVISGSPNGRLNVWDLLTGVLHRTLEEHSKTITAAVLTPDNQFLISASSDQTLKLWSLASGKCIREFVEYQRLVHAIAITPDGTRLVSGHDDGSLCVWETQTGRLVGKLEGHTGIVSSIAITPDGCYAVSGSHDTTIRIWDLEAEKPISILKGHPGRVLAVAIAAGGAFALSACSHGDLKIWDLHTARTEYEHYVAVHEAAINSVSFHPGLNGVVTGSDDRQVLTCNVVCREPIWGFDIESHPDYVNAVAFGPDWHVVAASNDLVRVTTWDGTVHEYREQDCVIDIDIAPDGRRVITASIDGTIALWDLKTGMVERMLRLPSGWANKVVCMPNGHEVIAACSDSTLCLWDLKSETILRTMNGHQSNVSALAVASSGTWAVSGSWDSTIKVWDVNTGKNILTINGHTYMVNDVAITPDDQFIVSVSTDRTLRIWHAETGVQVAMLVASAPLFCCAVSPDGESIVAGDGAGGLHVLDWIRGDLRLARIV